MKSLLTVALLFAFSFSNAQTSIFGKVKDENNNGIEAKVAVVNTDKLTYADANGSFRLDIGQPGEVLIEITHIGYQNQIYRLQLDSGTSRRLNVNLVPDGTQLESITVTSEEINREKVSTIEIGEDELEGIPAITGGVESLIKTLPGVNTSSELSAQYSVRGGNYDENLVFIDDWEVYRSQLVRSGQQEGLSVLNPSLTRKIHFSSGGFEPQFGDKLSSVLSVDYKDPKEFKGSAELGFLGAGVHLEDLVANEKVGYALGGRYSTSKYLLNTLDEKGEYNPYSYDLQGKFDIELSNKSNLEVLGYGRKTVYDFEPDVQNVNLGTFQNVITFNADMDGEERDEFKSYMGGLKYSISPNERTALSFTSSLSGTNEKEDIGITSVYLLGNFDPNTGTQIDTLSAGIQYDSVLTKLKGTIVQLGHTGALETNNGRHFIGWGANFKRNNMDDSVFEFEALDNIDYDTQQITNVFFRLLKTGNRITINNYSAFVQDTYLLDEAGKTVATGGLRLHYSDYTKELLFNPRLQLSHRPDWKSDIVFRGAVGLYHQPPFYREIRKRDGSLNSDIKAQKSLHAILGSDLNFTWRSYPMKLTAEAYYKNLWDVIPYEYDNIRIRYLGENNADANVSGLDFRINGEFVEDAQSWISLSFLKAEEDVDGEGTVRRPTDQRFKLSLLFQDYMPGNKNFRVKLAGQYGSRLPTGIANGVRADDTYELPAYRRVDVGFAANLKRKKEARLPYGPFEKFKSFWLTAELYNMFNTINTYSYNYIFTPNDVVYTIPNGLTSRRLNLKLSAKF